MMMSLLWLVCLSVSRRLCQCWSKSTKKARQAWSRLSILASKYSAKHWTPTSWPRTKVSRYFPQCIFITVHRHPWKSKTKVICVEFLPDAACQKLLKLAHAPRSYSQNKSGMFLWTMVYVIERVQCVRQLDMLHCSEKNTHSHFLLYLPENFLDFNTRQLQCKWIHFFI